MTAAAKAAPLFITLPHIAQNESLNSRLLFRRTYALFFDRCSAIDFAALQFVEIEVEDSEVRGVAEGYRTVTTTESDTREESGFIVVAEYHYIVDVATGRLHFFKHHGDSLAEARYAHFNK